jgi:hypothetical protein
MAQIIAQPSVTAISLRVEATGEVTIFDMQASRK